MLDLILSDELGKSDDVMNDIEENSLEGKNKKIKEKFNFLFMLFNKYGNDIKKYLEFVEIILMINNDLDFLYKIVKYEFNDIKLLLLGIGFEFNFIDSLIFNFFEFYDILFLFVIFSYVNNSDK